MVTVYEILIGGALIAVCGFASGVWQRAGGSRLLARLLSAGVLAAFAAPILWRLDWAALAGGALPLGVVVLAVGGYALLLGWIRKRASARLTAPDREN